MSLPRFPILLVLENEFKFDYSLTNLFFTHCRSHNCSGHEENVLYLSSNPSTHILHHFRGKNKAKARQKQNVANNTIVTLKLLALTEGLFVRATNKSPLDLLPCSLSSSADVVEFRRREPQMYFSEYKIRIIWKLP